MILPRIIYLFLIAVLVTSCGKKSNNDAQQYHHNDIKYARYLSIIEKDGYKLVEITNPWDTTSVLAKYVLVPSSSELPKNLPDGTILRTPLTSTIVYSSVHAGAIKELGCVNNITGVVDAIYYKIPEIVERLESGKIIDAGNSQSPIVEKIIELSPQAILLSLYEGMDVRDIDKLGIPILKFIDNMEATPLGRAEWIKFIGILYGQENKADSIFSEVEKSYTNLVQKVQEVKTRPTVLVDNMYQGVWYVSGGKSYQARLLEDAGSEYLWNDDSSAGSLNLSFEQVLNKAHNADFWLIKTFGTELTKESLLKMDGRYSQFDAIENGGVFYSNTQVSTLFEEFPFHPDLLLSDYISIFHPEIMPREGMRYFKQMPIGK